MNYSTSFLVLSALAVAGCGSVGSASETVSLASGGVNVSVELPTGGKVVPSSIGSGAEVKWVGLSWNASFELSTALSVDTNRPLAQDASGAFEARTPIVVGSAPYTCWIRAKKEADAKRLQAACDKLAAASPKPSATDKTAAPTSFELEDKHAAAVGCSIKIPKGAKTLMEDKYNSTYSLPFPGGLFELNVSVNQAGASSLDDAKRTATLMSGTVQDAKKLPSGLLEVVLAPQGALQTVSTFLPKFGAKCEGPKANLATLLEMCESLTAGSKVGAAAPAAAQESEPAKGAAAAKSAPAKAAPAKPSAPAGGAASKPAAAAAKPKAGK